jgi:DNA-binding HxlR family transcriptional regulator
MTQAAPSEAPTGSPTMAQMPSASDRAAAMTTPPATSLEVALDRVGDRWSLLLVEVLLDGRRRFGELAEALPGIAPNILTDRLRRLERAGIVLATPYSERPPRMEYLLTADGHDLASALRLLADWGARHATTAEQAGYEPMRHQTCGTPLEARWFCPTCTVVVAPGEADELRSI